MEQVVYAKFSRERKKEYGIVTKIIEKKDGKCVRKSALTDQAKSHVRKMCSNMDKLQDYYLSDHIVIAPCFMCDDGTVEFSFIEGIRYDKQFSRIISTGNIEKIQEELKCLKDVLYQVRRIEPFEITRDFEAVFGKNMCDALNGKKAYTLSNVDMIFANMIIKEGKIYITDYEWVFDFMVPVDYILYRSLLLNIDFSMLDENMKQELLSFLNITDEDKRCYEKMEEGFQQYVSGKNLFSEYKKNSTKKTVRLSDISAKSYPNCVQMICRDKEDNIVSKFTTQYRDILSIEQELTSEVQNVKVQFEVEGAVLQLQECSAVCKDGKKVPLTVTHNATFAINNDYYFDTNYPYFEIKNENYDSFDIKVLVYYENSSVIGYYIKKIMECEAKNQQVLATQNQIIHAENRISELEAEIERMKNTKAWKIYSKIKRL